MPGRDLLFVAKRILQNLDKGVTGFRQANERQLILTITEKGVCRIQLLLKELCFRGAELSVSIAGGLCAPDTSQFEVDLASGLLPEEDILWSGSEPQETLDPIEAGP